MTTRVLLLIVGITCIEGKIDLIHCRHPLGMQDKRIPDEYVTASSFHARSTGPNFARLGREEGDGAWCPKGILYPGDEDHWLQVQLPSLAFVSLIETQGRDANGVGQEYTPSYKLNYSRDGRNWFQWKSFGGDRVLKGNIDATSVHRQKLSPGIPSVLYLRFIPRATSNPMSVCTRIELLGCKMSSGIVQYDVPAPGEGEESRTTPSGKWSFDDELYDGSREGSTYRGGLGQLTDGVIGSKNIHETISPVRPWRTDGFDYVGWLNNERGDRDVMFTFAFADVKNFTSVKVHCLSSALAESSFPSHVKVSFSLSGQAYQSGPYASNVAYDVLDSVGTEARTIVVPLGRAVAQYVQATFRIRGKWLLISEIEFETEKISDDDAGKDAENPQERETRRFPTNRSKIPTRPNKVAVIGCSLAGVIALLVVVVIFLICRHRKLKKTMTPPRYSFTPTSSSIVGPYVPNVTLCLADQRAAFANVTCPVPEKCADPIYHEVSGMQGVASEYFDPKGAVNPWERMPEVTQLAHQSAGSDRRFEQPDVTMCASGVRDGVMAFPNYSETAAGPPPSYATPLRRPLTNSAYATPWISPCPSLAGRRNHVTPTKFAASFSEASTALLADEVQSGGGFQAAISLHCGADSAILFPREGLEFVEKLGKGEFGDVRLCKACASLRRCAKENGISLEGGANEPVLVAVKAIRKDASLKKKEDFLKEVETVARLRDPNIIRLLAVMCTEDEPYGMIIEYAANGDLCRYLQKFETEEIDNFRDQGGRPLSRGRETEFDCHLPTISLAVLMSMTTQIAAGMKYLASLGFVHRDLASRNCLVSKDRTIRIAAYEMMHDTYVRDYYKMNGEAALPIRWMSWESILLEQFSAASDVWAFGVTTWEIFTLCKRRPYHALGDGEVIDNMHHIFQRTGDEVYLSKPKACPSLVFNMVRQCWKTECEDRPGFDVLYSFMKEHV